VMGCKSSSAAAVCAVALLVPFGARAGADQTAVLPQPVPLPPHGRELLRPSAVYSKGRAAHLALIRQEAERQGLPVEVADAVAAIESSYDPGAVGVFGEVGLMQIRPQTAYMLGYKGAVAGLFEPETNVHYSVAYLAGAWRRANGDLCRALMKYRAGHREERISPLSADYCRRAKSYLTAQGSSLAQGDRPSTEGPPRPPPLSTTSAAATKVPPEPRVLRADLGKSEVAGGAPPRLTPDRAGANNGVTVHHLTTRLAEARGSKTATVTVIRGTSRSDYLVPIERVGSSARRSVRSEQFQL
jgi:hypothetical protein